MLDKLLILARAIPDVRCEADRACLRYAKTLQKNGLVVTCNISSIFMIIFLDGEIYRSAYVPGLHLEMEHHTDSLQSSGITM